MITSRQHSFQAEADKIQALIDAVDGYSDEFVASLHDSGLAHISFSQVYAFESCPRQYYLRYILGREITPVPEYFKKGRALHRMIADAYRSSARGLNFGEVVDFYENCDPACEAGVHLRNGYQTFLQNRMLPDEIIGIEKAFVFLVEEDIPPVVGIIDLVIRCGETIIMIDHKTGRDFYQPDLLQMAVYLGYIRSAGYKGACEFYYDNYRWVRNLARIRKPAFERNQMAISESEIQRQLSRLSAGYQGILRLQQGSMPPKSGECFRCAYRHIC